MFAKLRNETRRRNPEVDLLKFNSRNRINWGRDPPPVWGRIVDAWIYRCKRCTCSLSNICTGQTVSRMIIRAPIYLFPPRIRMNLRENRVILNVITQRRNPDNLLLVKGLKNVAISRERSLTRTVHLLDNVPRVDLEHHDRFELQSVQMAQIAPDRLRVSAQRLILSSS